MKRLAVILLVMVSALFTQAATSQGMQCGPTVQGGVDVFPWSLAQPFPWSSIQGLWKVSDEPNVVLKFKVTRVSQSSKHLMVEVYDRYNCTGPEFKGVGIINASEKNVVRINLTDTSGNSKLMKLAMFESEALQLDKELCGSSVLAASLIDFEIDISSFSAPSPTEPSNMMLKKITNSLDFKCNKRK